MGVWIWPGTGLRRLRRHDGIHGRAVLLLEGDEGAVTDREKRPAMVSCGGNRERSERERAQRREEKQGTRESRGGAGRRWSRALKVVASIATRSSAGWKRGGGRHSGLLLLLGWPATTSEAEA